MTPEAKRDRAKQLVNDELLQMAFAQVKDQLTKRLLAATTPEDRERRWQEYHGVDRAWTLLAVWAAEA